MERADKFLRCLDHVVFVVVDIIAVADHTTIQNSFPFVRLDKIATGIARGPGTLVPVVGWEYQEISTWTNPARIRVAAEITDFRQMPETVGAEIADPRNFSRRGTALQTGIAHAHSNSFPLNANRVIFTILASLRR